MRNARFTGWGAAALAAVLVATASSPALALEAEPAPAPIEAVTPEASVETTPAPTETTPAPAASTPAPVETTPAPTKAPDDTVAPSERSDAARVAEPRVAATAEATGDLVVRSFDDYYADGVYDPSKTARDGRTDQNTNGRLYEAITSTGARVNPMVDENGDYRFEDLPVGETKVYFTHPNNPGETVFFDATGATSAAGIERLANGSNPNAGTAGVASVDLGAAGASIVIGMTAVGSTVAVKNPDGTPAVGLTGVEFGSGGTWYPATEYLGLGGSYEALVGTVGMAHVPDEIGLRIAAPAGYRVGKVELGDALSWPVQPVPFTERAGAYWFDTVDLGSYFSRGDFTVTLEAIPVPTGDLVVRSFDDYYADGVYDPSKTARDGRTDQNTNGRLYEAITSTGARVNPMVDENGDYRFEDLPVGETKVYFTHPNNPAATAFFYPAASGAGDVVRVDDGSHPVAGTTAVATVDLGEDGDSIVVGMASASSTVAVKNFDGTPATGLTGIEFGSAGEWFPATEYAGLPGSYEVLVGSTGMAHLPDEIGLRMTVPEGYQVGKVELGDARSWPVQPVPFTQRDGAYWFKTVDLGSYSSRGDFTVTLEEEPSATLDVTYFGDVVLDGTFDPAEDLPIATARIYLLDADGEWWATTAGTDGVYRFPGAAIGPATIYAELPEPVDTPDLPGIELPDAALSIWDATGLESYHETVRAETDTISFEGTSIDPVTGATTPLTVTDEVVGVVPAELKEGAQEREIGAATILQLAIAADAAGTPSTNVDIEFLANDRPTETAEVEPGAFVATDGEEVAVFGAAEYGIRANAAEGYEVTTVTALSLQGEVLDVQTSAPSPAVSARMAVFAAPAGTVYSVAPEQVGGPIGGVIWAVEVAPITVVTPTPDLPSTPGVDLPRSSNPAPVTRALAATGGAFDATLWLGGATLLLLAGAALRFARRRTA